MRRMAKQQNKSLGQSGRSGMSAKAAKQHQATAPAGHASLLGSDGVDSPSASMRHAMNGLSPKQATVFKDCYNVLMKNTEGGHHHDDSVQDGALGKALVPHHHSQHRAAAAAAAAGSKPMLHSGGSMTQKKSNSSKRKRKDLRICTGVSVGLDAGMFLPDTPRRVLHTQLLLQLLGSSGSSDDVTHINPHNSIQIGKCMDPSAMHSAKRKKRNGSSAGASGKNAMLSIAMQPSKACSSNEYNNSLGGEQQQHLDEHAAFNDMDGPFHSFEHLDIDFNEVHTTLLVPPSIDPWYLFVALCRSLQTLAQTPSAASGRVFQHAHAGGAASSAQFAPLAPLCLARRVWQARRTEVFVR